MSNANFKTQFDTWRQLLTVQVGAPSTAQERSPIEQAMQFAQKGDSAAAQDLLHITLKGAQTACTRSARWIEAECLLRLANLCNEADPSQAEVDYRAALGLWETLDPYNFAVTLQHYGCLLEQQGRRYEAWDAYHRSQAIFEELVCEHGLRGNKQTRQRIMGFCQQYEQWLKDFWNHPPLHTPPPPQNAAKTKTPPQSARNGPRPQPVTITNGAFIESIPVFQTLSAGLGVLVNEFEHPEEFLEFHQLKYRGEEYTLISFDTAGRIHLDANADYVISHVEGDSMNQANIREGDLVLIRKQRTGVYVPQDHDVVAAVYEDTHGRRVATIKKFKTSQGRKYLIPSSDNPIHQPIACEQHRVEIIGRVIAVLKRKRA